MGRLKGEKAEGWEGWKVGKLAGRKAGGVVSGNLVTAGQQILYEFCS